MMLKIMILTIEILQNTYERFFKFQLRYIHNNLYHLRLSFRVLNKFNKFYMKEENNKQKVISTYKF